MSDFAVGDYVKAGFTVYRVVNPVYRWQRVDFVDAVEIRGTNREGTAPRRLPIFALTKLEGPLMIVVYLPDTHVHTAVCEHRLVSHEVPGVSECYSCGPHSADTVTDAAAALAGLVRYLNNATGPGNGPTTLAWAPTVHRVLGGVGGALHGLVLLFEQLAEAVDRQAADPTLYDDRHDRPPSSTAEPLADQLRDLQSASLELARQLDRARNLSVHLGNDLSTTTGEDTAR